MKQRYDSYKPSGIDWIGDIPSHWVSKRLRYVCEFRNGYTPSKANGDYWSEGTIPWYRMEDIRESGRFLKESKQYVSTEAVKGGGLFEAGSFILATTATIGEHAMLIVDSLANQQFTNLKIRKSLSHTVTKEFFFYYLFVIDEFCKSTTKTTTFPAMDMTDLRNLGVSIPPLAEQEAIAAWLDEKCEDIDAAIAKVDREIELIDELKQSEISRVVTRGLNPDAPLCPSGIDWIGDIPEHWTKCRLKFIGSARNGLTYSPSDVKDSGKLVIRSSNIQDSKLNYDDCVFVANYPETLSVNSGDTIICSRNGSINLIGKSVFIEDDMDVTFGAFMMRFRPYEHPKYSHYLLSIAISRYKGLFATTTINQLTADSLGKMEAVMPPYMEQVQIADYLDKKCAAIDGLKAKLIKKRETLTELRQSIISEVVTGKRKVI